MICNMACSCGQNIEFSAEDAGRNATCPTCQASILLQMDYGGEAEAAEPQVPPKRYRLNFRRLLTLLIWTVGLFAAGIILIVAPQVIIVPAMLLLAWAIYFLPCFVGRHKRNGQAIAVLNLLLG